MTEAEGDGDVQVELVFPMEHEEGPVKWICPKLSVSPAEVDFVEKASLAILENLVSQGGRFGKPEFKGGASHPGRSWVCPSSHLRLAAWRGP